METIFGDYDRWYIDAFVVAVEARKLDRGFIGFAT
jgi:hypothetical protein